MLNLARDHKVTFNDLSVMSNQKIRNDGIG